MDAGKEYMRMLEEEWKEMREEFSFLKEENINNLQKRDLPGEKWFEVYYKDQLFKTRMSNLGRFKIGDMIIERNDIRVPFGQICIVYKEVQSTKDKRKNFIIVRAIDVMRTTRDYYGDGMFELVSVDPTVESKYPDPTVESKYPDPIVESKYPDPTVESKYPDPIVELAHYEDDDIVVFNNDGEVVKVYKTKAECSKDLDIPYETIATGIRRRCHVRGLYRIYRGRDLNGVTKIEPKYYQEIRLYDPAGHFVEEFEDYKSAANKCNANIGTIRCLCHILEFSRQCNGYLRWKKDVGNAEVIELPKNTRNNIRWVVLDSNKNIIGYFTTSKEVAELTDISKSVVTKVARGFKNHYYNGYYIYREDKYLKIYKYHEEE